MVTYLCVLIACAAAIFGLRSAVRIILRSRQHEKRSLYPALITTVAIYGTLAVPGACARRRMLIEGICPNCRTPMETSYTLKNRKRVDLGFHCLGCTEYIEFGCKKGR